MEIVIKNRVIQEGAAVFREIRELEDQFRTAMLDLPALKGVSGGAEAPGARSVRSPLHAFYPALLRTAFPEIREDQIRSLCRIERLFTEHLLACDRTIDQRQRFDPLSLFVSQLKQFEALRALYGLFPPGHPFWSMFREYAVEAWRAVFLERLRHSHRLVPYPLTEFERSAKGRTALFKVFALALGHLSSREGLIGRISLCLDQHHVGLVLLDDLEDWWEDYEACDFSYPLTRVILENGLEERIAAGDKPAPAEIGSLLFRTGVGKEQLRVAQGRFRKAMDLAQGLDLRVWVGFNREYVRRCSAMSRTVEEFEQGHTIGPTSTRRRPRHAVTQPRSLDCGAGCPVDHPAEGARSHSGHPAPAGPACVRWAESSEAACRPLPAVMSHSRIQEEQVEACRVALEMCSQVLPNPGSLHFFLGTWPGLPAHFLLASNGSVSIGVQLDPACEPVRTTAGRPLQTEVTIAYVKAQRFLRRGPLRSDLEKLFVTGMGLRICLDRSAGRPHWELVGMTLLDWQWCQKNEWLLWAFLDRQVGKGQGAVEALPLASDPSCLSGCLTPRNADLYLSLRAYDSVAARVGRVDLLHLLETWGPEEIAKSLGPCLFVKTG